MDSDEDQFPDGGSGYSSSLMSRLKGGKATDEQQTRRVRFDDSSGGAVGEELRNPTKPVVEASKRPAGGSLLDWWSGSGESSASATAAGAKPASRGHQQTATPASSVAESKVAQNQPKSIVARQSSDETINREGSSPHHAAYSSQSGAEVELLRKEISALRYEKSEDQRALEDVRRRLDNTLEEHQKLVVNAQERHRSELQEVSRRYEHELEDIKRTHDKYQEILTSVKSNEASFEGINARIDTLAYTMGNIREVLQSVSSREDEVNKVLRLIKEQQEEHFRQLDKEKDEWKKEKTQEMNKIEIEIQGMSETFSKEVIEGRQWIEEEKSKMSIERRAFQEEQMLILEWMEKKRDELDSLKSEFLTREHDLLVRVVNEKNLLEMERFEFEQRKNEDVMRIREEASQLERNLAQVENAKNALIKARNEYQVKIDQLNGIKEMLLEYEKAFWKERKRKSSSKK